MLPHQSTIPPVSNAGIIGFYDHCAQLFDGEWTKYSFPEQEVQEMISRCLTYYDAPEAGQRIKSWRSFIDLVGHMTAINSVSNYSALTGLCLLNNFAFDWEDDLLAMPVEKAIAVADNIIQEFYPEQFQRQLFTSWWAFICNFPINRKYAIKEKILLNAHELYVPLRMYDGGVHPYMSCLAAAYNDYELFSIMSQGYTLQMVTKCLIYVNDVFSFNKEIVDNEAANHLIIHHRATNRTPDLLLEDTIRELTACVAWFKLFFPHQWNIFSFWFRGNLEWSFITHRYNAGRLSET